MSETQVANLARAFSEEVKSSVNAIDLSLIDLRDRWISDQSNFAQAVKKRQAYLEQDVGFQVAIINETGILNFSSADPQAKPVDLSDREHFRVHQQHKLDQLFISKPIFGRVTKRWSIQFTRPITDRNGKFAGVIVLSVAPEYFSRFLDTINLGKDSAIAVLRTGGTVLARSPNQNQAVGKKFDDFFFMQNPSINHGLFRRPSRVDSVDRVYGWHTVPKGSLAVLVGQSIATALQPYYQQRRTYLVTGTVLSFLLAVIGYILLSNWRARRQNEQALLDSLDQLKAEQSRIKVILENSHDAFVAVDSQGRITDWNKKAELMFGWPAQEAIGKDLSSMILPEGQHATPLEQFSRIDSTGKNLLPNMIVEVEALHRSGRLIPVEIALAGFQNGKTYAANAFIRDISERKEAERLDRKRLGVLEETRKALQQSQKLEALGRLTGGIAHDFNNVLQTLTTGIQVALRSTKDEKIQRVLQASERAVQKGVDLTRQLLVFGRVQDANLKTVDLAQQVNATIPLLRGALPSNIRLTVNLEPGLWQVEIDPLQFELALLNLAMNSRDAMPGGGSFSVDAHNAVVPSATSELEPGNYVRLVITDTGEGMEPDVLARALDPFFTTKAVGKGSGMGLAQVYGFVKQIGGSLGLHSQIGEGLEVSIYLPQSRNALVSEAQADVPPVQSSVAQASVLFVEDDPLVQQTVRPALEGFGFRLLAADNADEALAILKSGQRIDVVFSDIVMPGEIGGIDLANIIRTQFPDIGVVLATGYSERRVSLRDVRTISKPYEISTVIAALEDEIKRIEKNKHAPLV